VIQEPPELVAMRLALGQQLAALRESVGIVQQQIGHKTGYSRSSIAKAEAGRQLLTRDFWQTADELLKAAGTLLANYERVRRAKEEHEAEKAGRRSWPRRTLRLRLMRCEPTPRPRSRTAVG
jgi:transcriptional regulator with XRE-family HTH domain